MAVSTHEVIFLGNFADADTDESTATIENASVYQQSFGSAGSPLNDSVENITFDDANNNNSISSDNFGGETTTTAVNTTLVDSIVTVSMDVTYLDGTTQSFTDVLMFQTADGDLFLGNSSWAGGDIRGPDMKLIQSVNVTAVTSSNYTAILQNELQTFACYGAGTLVETPNGPRLIEHLRQGDLVQTLDHGAQPIRWIGAARVACGAKSAPIRIAAGALGIGIPSRDLYVSPQHRMFVNSRVIQRLTGVSEAFIAAKKLLPLPGVEVARGFRQITYVHLLFERHELIFANGAISESLLPGAEGLKMLGPKARAELNALFPELARGDHVPRPARRILQGRTRANVIARHLKNRKPMLETRESVGQFVQ